MNSGIVVAERSGTPAYRQIADQIRQRIATGDWEPGQEVPSIRALSAELAVSTITVRRAYLELEQEGVILSSQGRPSVVAEAGHGLGARLYEEEIETLLLRAAERSRLIGWGEEQLQGALRAAMAKLARRSA